MSTESCTSESKDKNNEGSVDKVAEAGKIIRGIPEILISEILISSVGGVFFKVFSFFLFKSFFNCRRAFFLYKLFKSWIYWLLSM